jgi:serine/threonine-protein kinase
MGRREDYSLEAQPLGVGGYSEVFRAVQKTTGATVAFKRALSSLVDEPQRRLKREIDVLRRLRHPNIIPLLDCDADGQWYTMPLAVGNLEQLRSQLSEEQFRAALEQIADALAHAHESGYVHRDVTPRNVLALRTAEAGPMHWILADWGLVRRPVGETSAPLTTGPIGTEGFLAPEIWSDGGHTADARADVYSLGRVAAWGITHRWPAPNIELLPEGPWRLFVRRTTAQDRDDRPSLMREAVSLLAMTLADLTLPDDDVVTLVRAAKRGDRTALMRAVEYALDRPNDRDVYFDALVEFDAAVFRALANTAQQKLRALATNMATHLGGRWDGLDYDFANTILYWLQQAAEAAVAAEQLNLLSDICEVWFPNETRWDRWRQLDRSRTFLRNLRGRAAEVVARVIKATPGAARYFSGEESWLNAAPAIRAALKSSPDGGTE